MRTQVGIIGGGPAGLLLSQLLHRAGVDTVVLERESREHVLARVRAGVLEWGTVEVLRAAGVADRMDRDGRLHDGTAIVWGEDRSLYIDVRRWTGRSLMNYGQTRIQEDLFAARDAMGGTVVERAEDVRLHDVETSRPAITYRVAGQDRRLECDFVAGCDGFHGISRASIPDTAIHTYEKVYPFGWLGILSETPPLDEFVYASHERGFAVASRRSAMLSRYYIQCDAADTVEDWPDDEFWTELKLRFPPSIAEQIVTGPSVEKSIAPLRSFVAEPMRYGSLFLAGDAAHIVPPTGAKGLNLAVSDAWYLSRAFAACYRDRSTKYLDCYSDMALRRVWGAVRFSWWLTLLLHRFPNQTSFDRRAHEAELDYIASSAHAQASLAEQYGGLAFEE